MCDNETTTVYRVMEEIEEVVGDKTTVEADDLDKLTYMNQVYTACCLLYDRACYLKQRPRPL